MKQKNMDLLLASLEKRILILDGAMGTMLQQQGLTEADFRGIFFAGSEKNLKGNNDVLCITCPDAVKKVHEAYLEAGADIIETNTFNGNAISQAEYGLERFVYDLNKAGAAVARECADRFTAKNPSKPRFVAGSMGPTSRSASMSPDINNPALRNVTFDELADTYRTGALGLIDGGADILLIETVFDTLNCKAAIHGIQNALDERGLRMPVMISGTVSDASGRLLTGQNVEAFLISVSHTRDLLSIGFNCALGAAEMRPHLEELARKSPFRVSAHPNAGLPDEFGHYRQTPEMMAPILQDFARNGLLNIAGGCCGTTPPHIRAIAEALSGLKGRTVPGIPKYFRLSGLEPLVVTPETNFVNIGERTNVAGSKKFLNLIHESNYPDAMDVARQQIDNGAQIIDINMDDALLDSVNAMKEFLLNAAAEPDIARVPFMIDSSRWEVIETALKCVQGKCVVNSISLKEGEGPFLEKAEKIRRYGAAVLVMAFDEKGQADTLERRVDVCRRSYRLLTGKAGFPPEDILFDPNVFAVATGMKEHDSYAKDFIDAVKILKTEMPLCGVSGGISNVSFSFRGNNTVREALHSVFLYHAIRSGLNFGIVNPAQLAVYEELPEELRIAAEDVILNRHENAGERLVETAMKYQKEVSSEVRKLDWRGESLERRIAHAMLQGDDSFIEADMEEALGRWSDPVEIIEGPLMDAMKQVGILFSSGKMFLPQVVKSARVMKKAVAKLMPHIEAARKDSASSSAGTILMATVKGDVHDIGKNIAGVVLQCNNYKIIDLGVMVPQQTILDAAEREHADLIGLSGLITPSLEEMVSVASAMERRGMKIPLMLGGATTSQTHTALKVAPAYPSGVVLQVHDASQGVLAVNFVLNPKTRDAYARRLKSEYARLRMEADVKASESTPVPFAEACSNALKTDWSHVRPGHPGKFKGITDFDELPFDALVRRLDWDLFRQIWKDESGKDDLISDARKVLDSMRSAGTVRISASLGFFRADSENEGIRADSENGPCFFPMLRQQFRKASGTPNYSLADFLPPRDAEAEGWLGCFAVGCIVDKAFLEARKDDDYETLLAKTLAESLAEAGTEYLHEQARTEWKDGEALQFIRPAPGYPACPDHSLKADIFRLLDVERKFGFALTESFMIIPAASVSGFFVQHPKAAYFAVGKLGDDQLADYAAKRNGDVRDIVRFIAWR
ncbi:MAG: Methionine synthase [Lentisphaerae bacterium ADurb.Bin242]|nr:MAG: Methionine synthase [Lentisphaerae bacterium ADurb.Bin242]